MRIGNTEFDTGSTHLMGILNLTPDSFSDGGRYTGDAVLFRVEEMLKEGMEILDIGGESTRPGAVPVSWEEEAERVLPVIEKIRKRFSVPISLDTYKSRVAREGIRLGVDMINDIWGLRYDADMAGTIAEGDVCCVLMHNRKEGHYRQLVEEVLSDLAASVSLAKEAGILPEKIILDPGLGFAKNDAENLELLRQLGRLKELGYPLLLGASRKSFIGRTLQLETDQRSEGTLVTTVYAVQQGCSFVRVHDVKENYRVIQMTQAIERGR